jgi:PAS domain S-box-containing protein
MTAASPLRRTPEPAPILISEYRAQAACAPAELLRSAFERSPNGIAVIARDGRWLQINDAYCRVLGYVRDELVGGSFFGVMHPDDAQEEHAFFAAAAAGDLDSTDRERRYIRKDGSEVLTRGRSELIRDAEGEPMYFLSHLIDIGERRAWEEIVRDTERTLRSVMDNTPAMISVKGADFRYKLVNRRFERFFGVSSSWLVGRSDSKILAASEIDAIHDIDRRVLAGETTQDEEMVVQGDQERVFLTTRFPLVDAHGEITAVCVASTDVTDQRTAERIGRERLECTTVIYSALAQGRFVLHGQPIVNLNAMQPTTVELLIRMLTTRGGVDLVEPNAFLPAAERFDLMHVIDEWVIDRAIELATAGRRVAVNVSATTVADPRQIARIEQAVAAGAAPENLLFEMTETAVADGLDAACTFATRIRSLGCGFALDDFGTGHGSFAFLRRVPIDYLKIDTQFVRNLVHSPADRQVVQAIVATARQFRIDTIAEGVEDQATLDQLATMGVDYAQGYWIGRPMPLPEVWAALVNRTT